MFLPSVAYQYWLSCEAVLVWEQAVEMPSCKGCNIPFWEQSLLRFQPSCVIFSFFFLLCTFLLAEINCKVWIEGVIQTYAFTYQAILHFWKLLLANRWIRLIKFFYMGQVFHMKQGLIRIPLVIFKVVAHAIWIVIISLLQLGCSVPVL